MKRKDVIKTILTFLLIIGIIIVSIVVFYQLVVFLFKVLIGVSIFFVFILGSNKKK